MLNVYLSKEDARGKQVIDFNDAWFNIHNGEYAFDTEISKDILWKIDKAKFIKTGLVESNFCDKCAIRIEQLSTGCKTLLNIVNCKDKVFNAIECGDNALELLFESLDGSIIIPGFILIPAYVERDINLVGHGILSVEHLEREVSKKYGYDRL